MPSGYMELKAMRVRETKDIHRKGELYDTFRKFN